MKHGRKEQFSITIGMDTATEFYKYMEKHDILYKNLAFEQLLKKGLNFDVYTELHDNMDLFLFKYAYGLAMDTALQFSKSKMLKKAVKLHYENVEKEFEAAMKSFQIADK